MRDSKYAVLLAPVMALLLAGVVVAGGLTGDQQNSDLQEDIDLPGGDDDCVCPQVYAPVVCVQPSIGTIWDVPQYETFSNSCFAGCAGYTRCRPAPVGVR